MSANFSGYGTNSNSLPVADRMHARQQQGQSKSRDLETASISSHSSNSPLLKEKSKADPSKTGLNGTGWTQEKLMAQALKSQVRIGL